MKIKRVRICLAKTGKMQGGDIFGARFKRFPVAHDPFLENDIVLKSKMSSPGHSHAWNEPGSGQPLNLHAAVTGETSQFRGAKIRAIHGAVLDRWQNPPRAPSSVQINKDGLNQPLAW
jgi:hypothetical protein